MKRALLIGALLCASTWVHAASCPVSSYTNEAIKIAKYDMISPERQAMAIMGFGNAEFNKPIDTIVIDVENRAAVELQRTPQQNVLTEAHIRGLGSLFNDDEIICFYEASRASAAASQHFMEEVRAKVSRLAGRMTARHSPRAGQLALEIEGDGNLSKRTIVTSSGDLNLDQAILDAVYNAAPFPAPEDGKAKNLTIGYGGPGDSFTDRVDAVSPPPPGFCANLSRLIFPNPLTAKAARMKCGLR